MVDQTVYLSGCIGLDPSTANLVSGGIEPEAEQVCTSVFIAVFLTYKLFVRASQSSAIELNWIEQYFTSPPTQYRSYGRRFLQVKRPNQQYQSTEGDAIA